ncbi:MAG: trigger factor [Erysipelotrichaceae bacterium]|nr:trigger factor [Erysipelotrichaceae bacterium]
MKTTWTLKEKSTGELLVTIDGEEWANAQEKAFNKLAKNFEMPGFRKGQAPKALVRKQMSDERIMVEAVDEVATDALFKGLEEHQLNMITRPTLDIDKMTKDEVTIKFIVTVAPEVKLGKYKGFTIKKKAVEVMDKDVEKRLKDYQERYAELVEKRGKVAKGNTAIIDFEGFLDGVAFEGGKGENYPLEIGSGSFIPGFEDQLIGMKANEEKDITVTFPENYQAEDLAGKEAVFKVTVHSVKQRKLPELDDEFAKEVEEKDQKFETLDDLRNYVVDTLTKEKTEEADQNAENELMSKVVDSAEVEIPDVMVEDELNQMVNDFKNRLTQQGLTFDLYTQFTGQDEAKIREEMGKDAYNRVKVRLVLSEIAKQENMEVTDEELEEEFQTIANMYNMDLAKVKEQIDANAVKYDLRIRKAYDLIKQAIK